MVESHLKVGELAAHAGVGVQTLHYYERLGLLSKPARSTANYRLYPLEALHKVQFIRKAQALGFSLEEIKEILELRNRGRAPCRRVAELGKKHLQKLMRASQRCAVFGGPWPQSCQGGNLKRPGNANARASFVIWSSVCRKAPRAQNERFEKNLDPLVQ